MNAKTILDDVYRRLTEYHLNSADLRYFRGKFDEVIEQMKEKPSQYAIVVQNIGCAPISAPSLDVFTLPAECTAKDADERFMQFYNNQLEKAKNDESIFHDALDMELSFCSVDDGEAQIAWKDGSLKKVSLIIMEPLKDLANEKIPESEGEYER